ncbi:hypothetical protein [Streptomyces sp. NPDC059142]|uniref:hypothetical protein n=1 Tax=Streptomyces sp. NPDC059142 TaxID=3346739 RepID=UPI00368CED4D
MTDRQALSAARLARLAVEALPVDGKVTFGAPRPAGGTAEISWAPETALAAAGHICQHWGDFSGISTRRLALEPARGFSVILRHKTGHGFYRIVVTEDVDGPDVGELCGHAGCPETAPAGAGSRCPDHVTDSVPHGADRAYWGVIAARAWARTCATTGEAGVRNQTRRDGVVSGGIAAGMQKIDIARITGIARTTIDRIIQGPPAVQADDSDGGAA